MSSLREVPGKMFQLAENRQEAGRELRDCVVETLQELMKDDDKITALEADLGGANVCVNGLNPVKDNPAATPIILASAIPH